MEEKMVHIKRRTVREDGKIFWGYKRYKKSKYPIWIRPETFAKWEEVRRAGARRKNLRDKEKARKIYENPPKFGTFNPETGLFYLRKTADGIGRWGTRDEYEKLKERINKYKKAYVERCKLKYPVPEICPGDKHPTKEGLFVIRIIGHKPQYGTWQEYVNRKEKMLQIYKNYRKNNKEQIKEKRKSARQAAFDMLAQNPHLRRKRGDIDPIFKKLFWKYNGIGKEMWVTPEEFERRRLLVNSSKRKWRAKKHEQKNVT